VRIPRRGSAGPHRDRAGRRRDRARGLGIRERERGRERAERGHLSGNDAGHDRAGRGWRAGPVCEVHVRAGLRRVCEKRVHLRAPVSGRGAAPARVARTCVPMNAPRYARRLGSAVRLYGS
jgi:hypothetical protein